MAALNTYTYDVLVIGAGGAGLRAAIEAVGQGVTVGLICKSLLGKAHTVMAEGGMAAAMGNVDDRDNWQVHFADTMRGGQYVNNWRMAELHAKEAPDRVRELEAWGAVFDRTPDGRILQRNSGASMCSRQRRSFSPPAAWAAPTASPATAGKARVTVTGLPIAPGRN
jgi:succinate dehydrogenase / fumarate reductase, flavoprotein subunit